MRLFPGDVVWVDLEPVRGPEQGWVRPGVVVSSAEYLEIVDSLVTVVPVTSRNRGWPNHVPVDGPTGLSSPSWAMVEQVRNLTRERVLRWSGSVDDATFDEIRLYLRDSLAL